MGDRQALRQSAGSPPADRAEDIYSDSVVPASGGDDVQVLHELVGDDRWIWGSPCYDRHQVNIGPAISESMCPDPMSSSATTSGWTRARSIAVPQISRRCTTLPSKAMTALSSNAVAHNTATTQT